MPDFTITRLKTVPSTNEYALEHLKILPDRHIVRAEIQTSGQGRLGRGWVSDIPGNIYASFILKPGDISASSYPLANISQYLSICICEQLDQFKIRAEIKWPNDIQVEGKKLGGILGQSEFRGNKLKGIILGTGINLNMSKADLEKIDQPATALNLLTGSPVEPDVFLNQMAERFFRGYDDFVKKGFPSIEKKYSSRNVFLGSRIRIVLPDKEIVGTAKGFDDGGCLSVADDEGRTQIITAGDVLISRRVT